MDAKVKLGIATGIAIVIIVTITISNRLNTASQAEPNASSNISQRTVTLRVAYFPNVTHAQAIIGLNNGYFKKILGDDVKIETQVFNVGPSAIEALFANKIDITYIGPNPAINGYIRSNGEVIRVIAGAASGGAVFVVRNDADINSIKDLVGKKFAVPQLGNTQDVALRKFLISNGLNVKEKGGDITIIPAKNPDIVTLMVKKEIDGAWVPEPWGAKLIKEANASIFVDERDLWPNGKFTTALVVVSTKFLKEHPDVVEHFIKAHVDITEWINNNPDEAIKALNEQIEKLTGQRLDEDELKDALSRLEFTYDPIAYSLIKDAENAYELGYLENKPDLSNIFNLTLLNHVLQEKGLRQIST